MYCKENFWIDNAIERLSCIEIYQSIAEGKLN